MQSVDISFPGNEPSIEAVMSRDSDNMSLLGKLAHGEIMIYLTPISMRRFHNLQVRCLGKCQPQHVNLIFPKGTLRISYYHFTFVTCNKSYRRENLEKFNFETDYVYTFDFYQHVLNVATCKVNLDTFTALFTALL